MKKIAIIFSLSLLLPLALGLATEGCTASQCEQLEERCDLCGDIDYQNSCEQTVATRNESLCAVQLRTFEKFCLGTGGGDAGGAGGGSGVCTSNETLCEGQCVNLAANPSYCGSCVSACADPTPFCSAGLCVAACDASETNCAGGCVDLTSDPAFCGSCSNSCADTTPKCENGGCVDACSTTNGLTDCNNSCVNLLSDPAHCGGCDVVCLDHQVCSAGSCLSTCASNETVCGGACTSLDNDPSNCGGCGVVCSGSDKCELGSCVADCSSGTLSDCASSGLTCVDTSNNPSACGASCTNCGPNAICENGVCGCEEDGEEICAPLGCVDTTSDTAHCGGCNQACDDGAICATNPSDPTSSTCTCENGQTLCAGSGCADTNTDPQNCGGCGNACTAGQVCDQGSCAANCSPGLVNCNGSCANLNTDLNFCGSCNNNCNDSSVCTVDSCSNGSCNNISGAGICNDGNPCTQDMCDATKGCTNKLYSVQDWAGLCAQLANVTAGSGQCVVCDSSADSDAAACKAVTPTNDDGANCTDPVCPLVAAGGIALATSQVNNCPNGQTCTDTSQGGGMPTPNFQCVP